MATPYDTIVLDEATSTQDIATSELIRSERPVLIVASRQTAGRGRTGRKWWQAPRGVAASLAVHPSLVPIGETFTLAVGLAVRAAVAEVVEVSVELKWPNDIMSAGRKVGGVLVERDEQRLVVGCGLNLWWPEPPGGVGALLNHDPGPDTGVAISEAWASILLETEGRWDREEYLSACETLGVELTWDPDGKGTAVDVDERGGLVVTTVEGTTTLRSGEVRTVRPSARR